MFWFLVVEMGKILSLIKGFDIAARSVAALSDTLLYFVGVPHRKHEEIAKHFVDLGIPKHCHKVRSYLNNQEDLKPLFCEVDLVLMPSRTDGFGLTGLEVLSAVLPLSSAKTQGLEKLWGVHYVALYLSLILKIPVIGEKPSRTSGTKTKKQLEEVKDVRGSYSKEYSWSKQCEIKSY